jgi:hypothetical protein
MQGFRLTIKRLPARLLDLSAFGWLWLYWSRGAPRVLLTRGDAALRA